MTSREDASRHSRWPHRLAIVLACTTFPLIWVGGLVTTFDAVHDQVDPIGMVQSVFDMLKPGGYWLCVDIQASSHVGENIDHPMGTFFYSVSCAHCMTVSLAHDGAGLGAMWGVQTARAMFTEAGFEDLEIHNVEGDITNNYYVCRRP